MAPQPKRKYAKARQGKRRSHLATTPPRTMDCPQCHSPKLSHTVCSTCGYYRGKEVIEIKAPKSKK